jgi:hypothetical protein
MFCCRQISHLLVRLTCALELARRVAGNGGPPHAGLAYIHALTELS